MQLDKDTVNEMFKDVDMWFSWYYKYEFGYRGETDDFIISTSYGGDSGDIYRYDVDADKPEKFENCQKWSYIHVENKKTGEEVFSESNYF